MNDDILLMADCKRLVVPETNAEWDGWISGGRLRNFCLADPLLDWLDRYGAERGFICDDALPAYDERTDFFQFLGRKGAEFEAGVMALLRRDHEVRAIASGGWEEVRSLECARETVAAMAEGVPIIAQAVLRNPERRTYGAADLLVRADLLAQLFPGSIPEVEVPAGSPALGAPWHYRVVDIKFTSLAISESGHALASKHLPHMAQVAIYNEAIGRAQGYTPPTAYVLGRTIAGVVPRPGCLARLASVDMAYGRDGKPSLAETVAAGLAWVREMRTEGATWDVGATPSHVELRPNLKNRKDQPWHAARAQIAEAQGEFTRLWNVGLKHRTHALASGLAGWRDPGVTATALGVTGEQRVSTLDALLEINRDAAGPPVRPAHVRAEREHWRTPAPLEFFVDFETTNSLDDDFSQLPAMNATPCIFMIGCGHIEDGAWRFACFTAADLGLDAERRAIDAWFAHMAGVTARLAPGSQPLVFHWSGAETQAFDTAFNAARKRHPGAAWPDPNWFDLLKRVVRAEPFTVRGAMGFGLKEVARALHAHGIIATHWSEGPADGLGAMAGAWWCNDEARRLGVPMSTLDLMRDIGAYNEVDCRVMHEILAFLRSSSSGHDPAGADAG